MYGTHQQQGHVEGLDLVPSVRHLGFPLLEQTKQQMDRKKREKVIIYFENKHSTEKTFRFISFRRTPVIYCCIPDAAARALIVAVCVGSSNGGSSASMVCGPLPRAMTREQVIAYRLLLRTTRLTAFLITPHSLMSPVAVAIPHDVIPSRHSVPTSTACV